MNDNKLHLYYCNIPNFGDQFNIDLFNYFGYQIVWEEKNNAEIIAVGSILGHVSDSYKGIVLGSGFGSKDSRASLLDATILAVRGKLSKQRVITTNSTILGDPGLLASVIYPQSETKYTLGLVPHYVDANNPALLKFVEKYSKEVILIDVTKNPKEVISEISSCTCIVSSSLHGLIVADSYRIPTAWMILSDKINGGPFKYNDYYSIYDENVQPLTIDDFATIGNVVSKTRIRNNKVDEIISNLYNIFENLSYHIEKHHHIKNSLVMRKINILRKRAIRKRRHVCEILFKKQVL